MYITVTQQEGKKQKVRSLEHFEEEWSGVAFVFENIDGAGEPDYKAKRKEEIREKIFKLLVVCSIAVLLSLLTCFAWFNDSSSSILLKLLLFLYACIKRYDRTFASGFPNRNTWFADRPVSA